MIKKLTAIERKARSIVNKFEKECVARKKIDTCLRFDPGALVIAMNKIIVYKNPGEKLCVEAKPRGGEFKYVINKGQIGIFVEKAKISKKVQKGKVSFNLERVMYSYLFSDVVFEFSEDALGWLQNIDQT